MMCSTRYSPPLRAAAWFAAVGLAATLGTAAAEDPEADGEAVETPTAPAPVVVEIEEEGVVVSDPGGRWSLGLAGRLHLDYNQFSGAYNAASGGRTGSDLFLRRARTILRGRYEKWDLQVTYELAEEPPRLVLARVGYRGSRGPRLLLGKLKEDVSLEAITSSKHSTAIERPMLANAFSPFYQVGVRLDQSFAARGLYYAAGAYRGGGFGTDGRDPDRKMELSLTGRLAWAPVRASRRVLHLAAWGSRRGFGGDRLAASVARGEVREPVDRLVSYAAGGREIAVDRLDQAGVEAAWVGGPLSLQGELAWRRARPSAPGARPRLEGGYLTLSWWVTGETRAYDLNRAAFVGTVPRRRWALELFGRYSALDARFEAQGTRAEVVTVGGSLMRGRKVKLMVNLLSARVGGPGRRALVDTERRGEALTVRFQFLL